MAPRRANRSVTFGVATGGLLVGHWIAYLIVIPAAAARDGLLVRTGHAYLGAADRLGLVLTLAALAAVFLGRITGPNDDAVSVGALGVRLAGFQVTAFLAMEVAERLVAGAPLGHLAHGPILPVGVAAQIVVAIAGTLVVTLLGRAADRAQEALGSVPPLPRLASSALVPAPAAPAIRTAVRAAGGRGPPPRR